MSEMNRPGGTIRIEPLTPERADACAAVIETLPEWFGYEGAVEGVRAEAARREGFVALKGTEVVGFVTVAPVFSESIEISYLAVRRDARNGGIGRRLVAEVCDKAREIGCEEVVLLTLGPSAESAHYTETVAFYRAVGFWRTKEVPNSDWGGAPSLVMSAPIARLEERRRHD
jgi:N-acetylglutamate synthase-like GNAT family acetyltransferase